MYVFSPRRGSLFEPAARPDGAGAPHVRERLLPGLVGAICLVVLTLSTVPALGARPAFTPLVDDGTPPAGDSKEASAGPEGANDASATTQPGGDAASADALPEFDATDLDDIELLDLDVAAVVTAARQEQKINEVPYAVTVITGEDIRRSGAFSVPDALRLAAGVDVGDLSSGTVAVSPRGFHGFLSRQVLVLVDGRQIYDSLFGGTLWNSWPVQLEDIERIEVIRGPGGVTWGANAMNGVVNIITKEPAADTGLTWTFSGGSRGWNREHFDYGFSEDRLQLRISGEFEGHDGFPRGGSPLFPLDDDFKVGRINLKAVYRPSDRDTLTVGAGHALVDGGMSLAPLTGIGAAKNPFSQASYLQFRWSHETADQRQTDLTAYVNEFAGSSGTKFLDYRFQQYALQLSYAFDAGEAHRIRLGLDTRADVLDTSYAQPFLLTEDFLSTGIIGLYIQDEWQLAPRWRLDLGARVDYEFYGGFQPSARAALSYDISENQVCFAAVSRAFQMPSVGLRHLNIPGFNGVLRATASQDVSPESVIAYELGYRGTHFDRLHTSASLFWHEYDDLTTLSARLGPPGLGRFHLDNRARASLCGVELEATCNVTDCLTLLGNYTYQRFDWRAAVPYFDKELMSPPRHKLMLGARYDLTDDWHLSAHAYYVDDVYGPEPSFPFVARSIDDYWRLDLRVEHEFWDDRAALALGVRNLLDDHHPEGTSLFLNNAEVPRIFYAELRLDFK